MFGQIDLIVDEGSVEPQLPWKGAAAIRPNNLEAGKLIVPIKPPAPAKVIRVKPLRHGKGVSKKVFERSIARLAYRQGRSRLRFTEQVPEYIVGYLALHAEHDQLGLTRVDPQSSGK